VQQGSRVIVVGGGLAGREAARYAVRLEADVTLITGSLDPRVRLDSSAVRFLAGEAGRAAQAWEPEGPSPGREYAPAMRETLVAALEIAAGNFDNQMAELQDIGVQIMEGTACVSATDSVSVTRPGEQAQYLNCRSMILAPGARLFFDALSPCVITPASMPSLEEVPESLVVLGSSAAALELARFLSSYGVLVTVVGGRSSALGFLDGELRARVVERGADNRIRILTEVTAVAGTTDDRVDLLLSDGTHVDADCVLPCGEGALRTEGLGLEGPGVQVGPDGEIVVDERMQTNIPGIFAVGSVTGRCSPNIAIRQAKVAAENALGGESRVNYNLIPSAVWFEPEIGAVGMTEEEAAQVGVPIVKSSVCFPSVPGPERCVKLIVDESTDRILGVHAFGDGAVEAVHMGALAMHADVTLGDIAEIACVEGTVAESVAAAALRGRQPLPELVHPLITGPE